MFFCSCFFTRFWLFECSRCQVHWMCVPRSVHSHNPPIFYSLEQIIVSDMINCGKLIEMYKRRKRIHWSLSKHCKACAVISKLFKCIKRILLFFPFRISRAKWIVCVHCGSVLCKWWIIIFHLFRSQFDLHRRFSRTQIKCVRRRLPDQRAL